MKKVLGRFILLFILLAFILALDGKAPLFLSNNLFSTAEAVLGRPGTPVSYAGVARRSPVGANRAGNRGGPVNRVGRR